MISRSFFDPLHNANQREEILDKYWPKIADKLDWWLSGLYVDGEFIPHPMDAIVSWWGNEIFTANRNLWFLRAFVAVMESRDGP